MSDLVTTGQAAAMLGVTPQTVINYINRGLIEATVLPSGHRRIERSVVEAFRAERAS